jgi:hypothetical protein
VWCVSFVALDIVQALPTGEPRKALFKLYQIGG